VVLTGEGADEVFVGYDIHRETKVRSFWSRLPESRLRPYLLARLHPYQEKPPLDFLRSFYGRNLDEVGDPLYSHRPRWHNTTAAGFLGESARGLLPEGDAEQRLVASLPAEFGGWSQVARAQYLEMALFMSGYLLSSQGDRMLMANSVEGRFPYLDHTLVEFAGRIPVSAKLPALNEKAMLKSGVADLLPKAIVERPKHPFRAPGSVCFTTAEGKATVEEFLLDDGPGWDLWQRDKVSALVRKWGSGRPLSQRDDLSFAAILSGRILQGDFGPQFEDRVAALQLKPNQIMWRN
jgi:asparagine synthase (glutamine-hydrolysing)